MESLLRNVFQETRSMSVGQLQTELNIFQQDLSSGLIEISYVGGEQFFLFFNEGELFNFYCISNNVVSVLDPVQPSFFFANKGDAQMRICPISTRFFRALRVAISHQSIGEKRLVATSELMDLVASLQKEKIPLLLQANWPTASGFVFIPGNNLPSREFLFVNENQAHGTGSGMTILSRWPEKECEIVLYNASSDMDIWREIFIYLGFSVVLEKIITRYDELAGRALVKRLEANLNSASRSQSLNISFADKSIDDSHTFLSLSDAASAYRYLFKTAFRQVSLVVGPKLVTESLADSLKFLSPTIQQILSEKRIFDQT